jgi:[ribosomal protein S18]-alanine N-acetyltransferase
MQRVLDSTDLPDLVIVEAKTQISPWTLDTFLQCIRANSYGYVTVHEGKIIGYILLLSQVGETHILNFGILPDFQQQGHGSNLLQHALKIAKSEGNGLAYLEVRASNHQAIALYKKMGFTQIGERKAYYSTPSGEREDALVFAKDLSGE